MTSTSPSRHQERFNDDTAAMLFREREILHASASQPALACHATFGTVDLTQRFEYSIFSPDKCLEQ